MTLARRTHGLGTLNRHNWPLNGWCPVVSDTTPRLHARYYHAKTPHSFPVPHNVLWIRNRIRHGIRLQPKPPRYVVNVSRSPTKTLPGDMNTCTSYWSNLSPWMYSSPEHTLSRYSSVVWRSFYDANSAFHHIVRTVWQERGWAEVQSSNAYRMSSMRSSSTWCLAWKRATWSFCVALSAVSVLLCKKTASRITDGSQH